MRIYVAFWQVLKEKDRQDRHQLYPLVASPFVLVTLVFLLGDSANVGFCLLALNLLLHLPVSIKGGSKTPWLLLLTFLDGSDDATIP
jgi:hypothetical protein